MMKDAELGAEWLAFYHCYKLCEKKKHPKTERKLFGSKFWSVGPWPLVCCIGQYVMVKCMTEEGAHLMAATQQRGRSAGVLTPSSNAYPQCPNILL